MGFRFKKVVWCGYYRRAHSCCSCSLETGATGYTQVCTDIFGSGSHRRARSFYPSLSRGGEVLSLSESCCRVLCVFAVPTLPRPVQITSI